MTYHVRITDAEDKNTYIAKDAFGRRIETLYASGDYEQYVYNGDGTLSSKAAWGNKDTKDRLKEMGGFEFYEVVQQLVVE